MTSDAIVYAEVFEILGYMNKKEVMRIPTNILEFLKRERKRNYISKINRKDIFNPNNIDKRSMNMIIWLAINYMGNDSEKIKLINICKNNTKRLEEIKKNKYSTKVLNAETHEENIVNENIVVLPKKNLFSKIIDKIKRFFYR